MCVCVLPYWQTYEALMHGNNRNITVKMRPKMANFRQEKKALMSTTEATSMASGFYIYTTMGSTCVLVCDED